MAMGRLSNRKGPVGRSSLLAVELAPRHSFYDRCNEILAEAEFDETVEMLCQPYYEDEGRLSVPPGRYFRMLFVGQFEGLDSEREIEWRCADSLSLHRFLRLSEGERVGHRKLRTRRKRSGCVQATVKAQLPPLLPPPIAHWSGSSAIAWRFWTSGRISVSRKVA